MISKLKKEGLNLQIISNRLLWKYLEYFTDLTDYSLCFDISIVVEDQEKATRDLLFINVKNITTADTSNESISQSMAAIKKYKNDYPFMPNLINILEYILKERNNNNEKI